MCFFIICICVTCAVKKRQKRKAKEEEARKDRVGVDAGMFSAYRNPNKYRNPAVNDDAESGGDTDKPPSINSQSERDGKETANDEGEVKTASERSPADVQPAAPDIPEQPELMEVEEVEENEEVLESTAPAEGEENKEGETTNEKPPEEQKISKRA